MPPEKQKLIDIAQRGRAAAALLNELGDPLDAMEERAINALILEFRAAVSAGQDLPYTRMALLVAKVSEVRSLREELESRTRAGRVAGERLHRDE